MGGAMGESEKTPRRSAKKARCAIYTRTSSEEGLEQAFNSLDARGLPGSVRCRMECASQRVLRRYRGG
jgi:hypothetical protein